MNSNRIFISCLAFFFTTIFGFSQEPGPFYSQYEQDKFVYNQFFKDTYNGVFVDIGAHNGVTINNTKFFEDSLNWTGICVEPLPEIFEELQKNRKALCIQGCITAKEGIAHFIKFSGGYYGEMFSGLSDSYPSRSLDIIKSSGLDYEVIDVQCYLLNNLLEQSKLFHVDYLSIDTEGGELDILKSIDFNRFDIQVIGVENNSNSEDIANYLSHKGYKFVGHIGADDFFKKKRRR